jgi:hypothetical protein
VEFGELLFPLVLQSRNAAGAFPFMAPQYSHSVEFLPQAPILEDELLTLLSRGALLCKVVQRG